MLNLCETSYAYNAWTYKLDITISMFIVFVNLCICLYVIYEYMNLYVNYNYM
jgi:hypothetical protein